MNRRVKSVLQVVGVSIALFAICIALFGQGGAFIVIGSVIGLPTLFTVLIARYARTNRSVAIGAILNVIAWETIYVDEMGYDSGRFFILHLVVQAVIAWSVRTRFKKQRQLSLDEAQPPFLTNQRKILFSLMAGVIAVIAYLAIGTNAPTRQANEFTDLDRRIIAGATAGSSEDFIGRSASKEHEAQNREEEASFWR